tara:strand:+ start:246 stop:671 length:426 start_codon:yes stop_codon:yes gene_type:complete
MLNMIAIKGDETHPYCPKCGTNLEGFALDLDESKLCPHIQFIYSDFAGEVVYCHDGLDARIVKSGGYGFLNTVGWDSWLIEQELKTLQAQDGVLQLNDVHPVESIMKRFGQSNWFAISVQSQGFACGPVFETVYVVYNLNE